MPPKNSPPSKPSSRSKKTRTRPNKTRPRRRQSASAGRKGYDDWTPIPDGDEACKIVSRRARKSLVRRCRVIAAIRECTFQHILNECMEIALPKLEEDVKP